MSCRGIFLALSDEDVAALLAKDGDAGRVAFLYEDLEERYFAEPQAWLAECDKAWDAMHRALTDGSLDDAAGAYPFAHVVLGGRQLHDGDEQILSLKSPAQVRVVAAALASITQDGFRARYDSIDPEDYGMDLSDEDFGYTWEWFQGVRDLFRVAAAADRHVLFSVDQ
jgi:hypothetical protein